MKALRAVLSFIGLFQQPATVVLIVLACVWLWRHI